MTQHPLDAPAGTHLPELDDIQVLNDRIYRIYEFNVETTGISDGLLLGLFLRAADEAVIGGAFGWTWGGTCYIRYLFVPANMRKQGVGTMLMRTIEKEAKSRGCWQIVLDTHDFQAPAFYHKLGFETVGHVADYPRGHQHLLLLKCFT